jgi:hypothetical protein
MSLNGYPDNRTSKVPEVTLAFWVIKIAATTVGETGGDALSMTLNLGYALSTAVFFAFFHRHGRGPSCFKILSPVLVLGRYCRDNHCRDDDGGLCGSLAPDRLRGRLNFTPHATDGRSRNVANLRRLCVFQQHRLAQSRNLLLVDDPLFEHARDRAGRLFRRRFGPGV